MWKRYCRTVCDTSKGRSVHCSPRFGAGESFLINLMEAAASERTYGTCGG